MGCNPSANRSSEQKKLSEAPCDPPRPIRAVIKPSKKPDAALAPPPKSTPSIGRGLWLALLIVVIPGATLAGAWSCNAYLDSVKFAAYTVGGGLVAEIVVSIGFLMTIYWDSWFYEKMKVAFAKVDIDKSGSVDKAELYAAVLATYAEVNVWVPVYVPDFEYIMGIMAKVDVDGTGDLSFSEFHEVMAVLSEQLLTRAVTQILFTFGCPVAAEAFVGVLANVLFVPDSIRSVLPSLLFEMAQYVPESLPGLVLSAVMMKAMPAVFAVFDKRSHDRAKEASKKLIVSTSTKKRQ